MMYGSWHGPTPCARYSVWNECTRGTDPATVRCAAQEGWPIFMAEFGTAIKYSSCAAELG